MVLCQRGWSVSTWVVCVVGTDELSRWWSAVLAVAAHWLAVSDDESSLVAAQRFYAVVDSMPKALQQCELVRLDCLCFCADDTCMLFIGCGHINR